MTGCIYKLNDGRCDKAGRYKSPCIGEACEHQTPSNYDRIVSMIPEELADYFSELTCFPGANRDICKGASNCYVCWLDWLKSSVEPGEVDDGNI